MLTAGQRSRIRTLCDRYRRMHDDPTGSRPAIIVDVDTPGLPSWSERLADPRVMMEAQLEALRPHLELEDDCIPTLRVELGTGQVASAFGCEIAYPEDSYPAVRTHVLRSADDVWALVSPSLHAGLYTTLETFTRYFRDHKPEGIPIQPPDLQSPFNCAHLIRGNDILTDFYDNSSALEGLLDKVTDYLIRLVPHLRAMIDRVEGWFLDYGALWKGGARISNCSMQMISPEHYRRHVLPRDRRLFRRIGGGRVHYCGTNREVVRDFLRIPGLSGLDFLGGMECEHVWRLAERMPARVVVMKDVEAGSPDMDRLLSGDWPRKRNLILKVRCASVAEGRDLLGRLRASCAGGAA